ncbi:hypothetical protein [Sphingopyxis sp. YF1]|uniref:hypothetical protein n=1 Tax=Sphingopyxis sp. YF1 TaxID=2482763 RepID=UPI001F6108F1|nr:hypothetical protein [Sphingopyxis sp. YF1]
MEKWQISAQLYSQCTFFGDVVVGLWSIGMRQPAWIADHVRDNEKNGQAGGKKSQKTG